MQQFPGLTHADRADIVARVEPKDKIQHAVDVDQYISAELPDPKSDPQGYGVISEMMVHGPCRPFDSEAVWLLGDDKEWHTALEEAAFSATSQQLRSLFAQILIFCDVVDPLRLWKSIWRRMSTIAPPRTVSDSLHIEDLYMNDPELEGGMIELMEEKSYNRVELAKEVAVLVPKLNTEQRNIYDMVLGAGTANQQEIDIRIRTWRDRKNLSLEDTHKHYAVTGFKENMRLLQPGLTEDERRRAADFATWLLEIGDGKVGKVEDNRFIYDEQTLQQPTADDLQEKAIVCPKNTIADEINATVLEILHGIQLSGTPTTHYYFNPDIPGLEELREQYIQRLNLNLPFQISKEKCSDINAEQNRNRFPLSTLLQQNPDGYRSVRFTCKATITNVNTSRDWYYQSCNDCLMKVTNGNGEVYCVNHGLQKPSYRYNFKAFLIDESATALVTFFTPNADVLTGSSCTQLEKKYGIEEIPTDPLPVGTHKPLQIVGPFQIEEIPTDPLPVGTPTQLPGISGSAQTITVTPLPTTPETPGTYPRATTTTSTTEGQPTDTPNPRAETTTKNTKRTLFGQESPGESKKKKE
ncbi:DNA helicase [Tanacetum coccineum]